MCLLGQKALQAGKGRSLPALAAGLGCLGRAHGARVSLTGTSRRSGRVCVGPAGVMVAVGEPHVAHPALGDAPGAGWGVVVHENRDDHTGKPGAPCPLRLLARPCLPLPPVALINLLPECVQSHQLSREVCACARCSLVPGLMRAPELSVRFAPCGT